MAVVPSYPRWTVSSLPVTALTSICSPPIWITSPLPLVGRSAAIASPLLTVTAVVAALGMARSCYVQIVGACAALGLEDQGVVAAAADQRVMRLSLAGRCERQLERVVANAAVQRVGAQAGDQGIAVGAGVQGVVARAGLEEIVARIGMSN